jgi:hydrogenase expression/formation protein HypC
MCLGIPMQITAINGYTARCEARDVVRDVTLFMLQGENLEAGDYIVVHLGDAIQKITAQEARTAWELYDQMLEGGYA